MKGTRDERQMVRRFSPWALFQHFAVMILFVALLLTGLPQKWPQAELSQWLVDAMGGVFATRWIHRVAGILFGVLALAHMAIAGAMVATRRWKATMFLNRQDFRDTIQNLRWYLGRTDRPPRFGRYDYKQKFEYWGMIMGGVVMTVTGLLLFFPVAVSRLLPAELIPVAKVMHSNEALLAMLIITVWHLYGAHLSPDVFPLDASMFTGKISKERLAHEHALEYDELFGPAEEGAEAEKEGESKPPRPPLRLAG
jgi:formate dehydrogenase gamma subunit